MCLIWTQWFHLIIPGYLIPILIIKLIFNYNFLNSLKSVRVFTRMVSDNPWCSLWVSSSQSWTSNITLIFSCLHIHERTILTKPDFQKIDDNWPISGIFTGIVRHIVHFESLKRWRSQVFSSWCGKIQTDFLFSKIAVFRCIGRYMSMLLRSSNSLHSILASVLC